jgi:hypothetical protein
MKHILKYLLPAMLACLQGNVFGQNVFPTLTGNTGIGTLTPDFLQSVKSATMVFHDNTGQVIKEITLTDRGNGSVTVQPKGLAAGVYTYSLTVDGKTVETNRMVKGN